MFMRNSFYKVELYVSRDMKVISEMVMRNSFYKVELYVSRDMKVISENLQVYPICLIRMI